MTSATFFRSRDLFPWLNVEKNVRFAARTPEERERVDAVLELTGLQDARATLPKALSGGMAQRAALARALVRKPSVLLLDEPLASLDALRRMQLQEALAEIIAAVGATAILVTHDIEEALYLADRIVVLGGSPSRIALEITMPPHKRRNRDANLNSRTQHAVSTRYQVRNREQESAQARIERRCNACHPERGREAPKSRDRRQRPAFDVRLNALAERRAP